mmetsp:Transcript_161321/g.517892  ORF Transcript_161321/g.517892 Transcript_161321/m.517892 type:complete len:88 (+) Transcript_161321:1339-1602(+)
MAAREAPDASAALSLGWVAHIRLPELAREQCWVSLRVVQHIFAAIPAHFWAFGVSLARFLFTLLPPTGEPSLLTLLRKVWNFCGPSA